MKCLPRSSISRVSRRGFTLVEMLVAITIFAILATIAITSFSESGSDRVPAAARQLRAMLGGAQSRAVKDKAPRGLRLFVDPDAPAYYVTSIAYVGSNIDLEGSLASQSLAATAIAPARTVKLVPSGIGWRIRQTSSDTINWYTIIDESNLRVGDRVYLQWTTNTAFESQERMFIVNAVDKGEDANGNWMLDMGEDLNSNMALDTASILLVGPDPPPSLTGNIRYRLEMAPEILPNSEPVSLPRGTVIDLDASKIPLAARTALASVPPAQRFLDIMYSARGELRGSIGGDGMIHFYVGQIEDSAADREDMTSDETPIRIINGTTTHQPVYPQRLVTLVPATGQVLTAEYISTAANPFVLAVQGDEAK